MFHSLKAPPGHIKVLKLILFSTAQMLHRRHLRPGPVRSKPLMACLGLVCGRDVLAEADSPHFDKAMMDGFAVCSRDVGRTGRPFPVSMSVFAGRAPQKLEPGTCCLIATGAAVPFPADTVVKMEDARHAPDGRSVIFRSVVPGENILPRSAHFKKGDKILIAGEPVGPAAIGLAASQGLKALPVHTPPNVAILSTGDEVVEASGRRGCFGIWNATGPMLRSVVEASGAHTVSLGVCGDDTKKLSGAIRKGLKADFLIVTGAVSVGERDAVPRILKKEGVRVIFHRVRMRPGKPVLFGKRGRTHVYGLPGNPVSTLVTYFLFVKPAIERWLGGEGRLAFETGFLNTSFSCVTDRLAFLPARLRFRRGRWQVLPLPYRDSADLRQAAKADCFFAAGSGKKRIAKGAPVAFLRVGR